MRKINIKDYNPDIESIWDKLYIGPIGEINRLIDEFNSNYDTDIGITKALSWKRGSYDKVRTVVSNTADGFNKRPKDMNHLFDLRTNNSWKINSIKTRVSEIQRKVWNCKYSGIRMNKDDAIKYFQSKKDRLNFNKDSIKALDKNSNIEICIIRENNPENATLQNDTLEIKVFLDDITIRVYRDGEFGEEVLANFPMGDVILNITYNMFSFINGTSHPRIKAFLITNENVRSHPYLKMTQRNVHDGYGSGYCMGDFDTNISKSIKDLDLSAVVLLCREWLSNYKLGYTNPLNRPDKWFFGYPEDLPQEYSLIYSGNIRDCSNEIIADISNEIVKDEFGEEIARDQGGWRNRYRSVCNSSKTVLLNYIYHDLYEPYYHREFYRETYSDIPIKNDEELKKFLGNVSTGIVDTCEKSKCKFRKGECKVNYNARYVAGKLTFEELESLNEITLLVNEVYTLLLNDVVNVILDNDFRYIQDDLDDKYGCFDDLPIIIRDTLNDYLSVLGAISGYLHSYIDLLNIMSRGNFNTDILSYKSMIHHGIKRYAKDNSLDNYVDGLKIHITNLNIAITALSQAISEEGDIKPLTNKEKLHAQYSNKIPNFENLSDQQKTNAIATIINSNNPF
jgi:hypothetical protein